MSCRKFSVNIYVVLVYTCLWSGISAGQIWGSQAGKIVTDEELEWDYVPNQLLVKFKDNTTEISDAGLNRAEDKAVQLSESLRQLNQQFRVRKMEGVFEGFRAYQRRVESLARKNPLLLNETDKRLQQRRRRVSVDVPVPDLDRIYLLEMESAPGQNLAEVLAAYRQNPDVEYAE
jgi:hypothetical protein